MKFYVCLILSLSLILGCEKSGCTDPTSLNYDPEASKDDGSCIAKIEGCTNPNSINYNPNANVDDGSCIAKIEGCTNPNSVNYNPNANVDDGSCTNHFAALGGNYAATVTRTCAVAGVCDSTYQDNIKVRWEGANLRMEVASLGVNFVLLYEPSASFGSTIYYSHHGLYSNESSAGVRLNFNSQQAVANYRPGSSGLGGPGYTFDFMW